MEEHADIIYEKFSKTNVYVDVPFLNILNVVIHTIRDINTAMYLVKLIDDRLANTDFVVALYNYSKRELEKEGYFAEKE